MERERERRGDEERYREMREITATFVVKLRWEFVTTMLFVFSFSSAIDDILITLLES